MSLSNFFFKNKGLLRQLFPALLLALFFLLFFIFPPEIKAACWCENPTADSCRCTRSGVGANRTTYQGVAISCDTPAETTSVFTLKAPICGSSPEIIPYCAPDTNNPNFWVCYGGNFATGAVNIPIDTSGTAATPIVWNGFTFGQAGDSFYSCGSNVFCCANPGIVCDSSGVPATPTSCSPQDPSIVPPASICSSIPSIGPAYSETPFPQPYVPCNETRPDEFHSLRPYQASPCNTQAEDLALFCGNDFILTDSFSVDKTFDPTTFSGSYSEPPAVPATPEGHACYACRGGTCSAVGVDLSCMGRAVAEYMNTVINIAGNLQHIRLLSPAFNIGSVYTPPLIQGMNAYPANWAGLDGIAVNAYNCCGRTVTEHIDYGIGNIPVSLPIMVTETGRITGTYTELGDQMNRIKGDVGHDYIGALFFNVFNTNGGWSQFAIPSNELSNACGGSCSGLGANSATFYPESSGFYDSTRNAGMTYTLSISNADQSTTDGVLMSVGRGLTPIIRIGTAFSSGPDAGTYANYLVSLDNQLPAGSTVYAIAGPNEPEAEPWAGPQCQTTSSQPTGPCLSSLNTCDPGLPNQCVNSPDCRDNGDGTETCWFNVSRTRDIRVNLQGTELPIMGYTEPSIGNQSDPYRVINSRYQNETVTDPQKVNEYVSWYLNGLIGRAEYDPDCTLGFDLSRGGFYCDPTPAGVNRLINFSGPLKRLLSWESQIVRRIQEFNKEEQGNIRHDQIVGCVDYSPFNFLGIVHCYPYGIVRPTVRKTHLSDFDRQLPPLQRDYNPALLNFLWNTYWNYVTPGQPPPPLPSIAISYGYWLQYQVWRFTNPVISRMFSYIPFSSTENRVGQTKFSTYFIQPAASSAVTILSSRIVRQSPSILYFSHMLESNELGELLQSIHSYKGANLSAPADPAIAPSARYCDIREIRSNPGDKLFATDLTATIQYNAQMSCTFAIRDPLIPGNLCRNLANASCQTFNPLTDACNTFYGQLDCPSGQVCGSGCGLLPQSVTCNAAAGPASCYPTSWGCTSIGILGCPNGYICANDSSCSQPTQSINLTQTCSNGATIAMQTVTQTPLADEIWSRLVAGPAAVFKRIFPKIEDAPGRPIRRLWDIPAASPVNYIVSGGALAGNPSSGRLGSQAELYFPHIGGIHEYFLNCIQKTLRPKGFGQGCVSAPAFDPYDPYGSPPSAGRCQLGTGFCSPTYLSRWFTGCHANQASVICNRESGGNPSALNDGCTTGRSVDYSVGLFQINLLAHPPECAVAFNYTWNPPSCQILNPATVAICEARFMDPDQNAAYAAQMSGGGQNWSPWGSPNVVCMQQVASLCP